MSTFISGVANPQASRPPQGGMTEALYKPPPRKPHIRRPPKTPHSFITGANKPAKRMTKEEREKFIEKKRADLGDAIKERTDAFVTHENVAPNLDFHALQSGDIHAVLGDKFDAILQEYGHKPIHKPPTKGTKNTGAEASVN